MDRPLDLRKFGLAWLLGSAATAGASLIGLGCLSSISESETRRKDKNTISTFSMRTFVSKFPLWDWRIWIGSAWIFLRQLARSHPIAGNRGPSTPGLTGRDSWHFFSDFAFVGLLFVLQTPGGAGDTDDKSSVDYDEATVEDKAKNGIEPGQSATSSAFAQRFLSQIERNLGLTPKIQNRGVESHSEQSRHRVPLHAESNHLSSPPTYGPPQQHHPQSTLQEPIPQQRYLELLVHNVSHTDLLLSLDAPPPLPESSNASTMGSSSSIPVDDTPYCLCRPRFSAFASYSQRIFQTLAASKENLSPQLISFPRYERSETDDRKIKLYNSGPNESSESSTLPIGFHLDNVSDTDDEDSLLSVMSEERSDLRIRGRDMDRLGADSSTKMNAVFFPLLAMLLPQWQAKLEEKYGSMSSGNDNQSTSSAVANCKKVVILVSGVGSPRNWTHSMDGNSTEQCAKLMELFIRTLHPDWVVVQVHSHTNIFRYDENISFVQNELLPCIQSYRDAHATGLAYPDEISSIKQHQNSTIGNSRVDHLAFDPDWRKTMNVTLSFADGSPARNHAIQAALRPYKPTCFHCWQLKTFWHESKIVDSDIEVHSFEEMETLPPVDLTTSMSKGRFQKQQPIAVQVVHEMKAFKVEMENLLNEGDDDAHDLRSFWLRKTQKPVLAVLAVQMTKYGPVKLYRGTNMEVSMPTGSLCAERNVIGTALADNPTLKRHHLKTIAVLSVPPTSTNQNPSTGRLSRPASMNSFASLPGVRPNSRSNSLESSDPQSNAYARPPRPVSRSGSAEWLFQEVAHSSDPTKQTPPSTVLKAALDTPAISLGVESPSRHKPPSDTASPSTTPARRISLYQQHTPFNASVNSDTDGMHTSGQSRGAVRKKRKTVVVVQHPEDLNPLRPCGACNEWLKKIAETNPYFQILTFTDMECSGIYCAAVAE